MGRLNPDPVHSSLRCTTPACSSHGVLEPHLVLRRAAARFFGKILKVDLIVKLLSHSSLPALPARPSGPCRRESAAGPWLSVVLAMALGAACRTVAAEAEPQPPVAAATQASPQVGPAESVYQKNAVAAVTPAADQTLQAVDQAAQAERIVAAALAAMGRAESISARVRQRVRVDDRVLVGAGRYVQSGLGDDQRYRYESSMKSDTETFDLLEVCDGLFAWSYRRLGTQPPYLERLDVRRIRDRLRQLQPGDTAAVAPHLGGMQRTLGLLRNWFRFVTVEPTAIDDLPIWRVEGRWHAESLGIVLPDLKEAALQPGGIAPEALPDGTPWSVRLSIGRRDLFPFRIEWLAIPGRRPVAARDPEPIAVLELYDVHLGEPVDAAAFVYKPAIEGLVDLTETHAKFLVPQRP